MPNRLKEPAPRRIVLTLMLLFSATHSAAAQVVNSVWRGFDGRWNLSINWAPFSAVPNNSPGATYTATINSGNVLLDVPVGLAGFTLNGGSIDLGGGGAIPTPQSLTTDSMLVTGGYVGGAGKLIVNGDLVLRGGVVNNTSLAEDGFRVAGDVIKRGYGTAHLGPFRSGGDYGIRIEQGKFTYGNGGLGSTEGSIVVAAPEFARLEGADPSTIQDDVYLNNGHGFGGTGALVSSDTGVAVGGNLYLGDVGATVGLLYRGNSLGETLNLGSRIHGGFLDIVGYGAVTVDGGSHTYTGPTRIGAYGSVTDVSLGANGQLHSTSAIEVGSYARLRFVQDQSGLNRIGDAIPLRLDGGQFEVQGVLLGSLPAPPVPLRVERLGALQLPHGASGVGLSFEVAGVEFQRLERGDAATINFEIASGTGVPSPYLKVGFAEAPSMSNGILGGWATVNGEDFAAYDSAAGIVPLADRVTRPSQVEGSGPNSHVLSRFGAPLAALSKDTTIATLAIGTDGSRDLDLGGHTLTLRDGGLIRSDGHTVNTLVHNGQLTAGDGSGPATLYLHAKWLPASPRPEGVRISANIVDNPGGPVSLVKSGNFEVTLSGANTYSGATVIQSAFLNFAAEGALPEGGELVVDSGGASFPYTPTKPKALSRLVLRQGGSIFAPTQTDPPLPRRSEVLLDADELLLESGTLGISLTGDGNLVKATPGRVELNNDSPTFSGPITIADGVLTAGSSSVVRAPQALGTGETTILRGGTLLHSSAGPGYMTLNARLNLAGGDVGIGESIAATRWDFAGPWRVTQPSRLLLFDPLGVDDFANPTVNIAGPVSLDDQSVLTVLGAGTANFNGDVSASGIASIHVAEGSAQFVSVSAPAGGGALRLLGTGRYTLPAALGASSAGQVHLEIGSTATAILARGVPLNVTNSAHLVVNGFLDNAQPVTLNNGNLSGHGRLLDVVNQSGNVAPGEGIATLTVGRYTQALGASLSLELLGGSTAQSDQLRAMAVTLRGAINVSMATGAQLQAGDRFNLVVATELAAFDLTLNTLGFDGRLSVVSLSSGPDAGRKALQLVVVPEPAVWPAAMISAVIFARRRTRPATVK